MSISIKSYQAAIPSKVYAQENNPPEKSGSTLSEKASSSATETVSISSSARALYALSSAEEPKTNVPDSDLKGLYKKGQSTVYSFGQLIAGGNYNKENMLPKTDDPDRLALGQQSLDYAIGLSQTPPKNVPNPFEGMARDGLSAIVYDDSGTYTDAERYAAYGALSKKDETYFSQLYAKVTNGGDNREIFKGILDYFDDLPSVEKAAYPDSFRESIDSLYQEQTEQWGPLALIEKSTDVAGEKVSLSTSTEEQLGEKTLQSVLEKAIELSKAKM
ncbi:hypothetical protein [Pseudomonas syringae]|uniref:hypothetical protein n=1 Tax=Pseudomonas syringae TaxID=317 RepID=UPI001FD38B30|nr:hypothetical protein [Pseudomonas syringae]